MKSLFAFALLSAVPCWALMINTPSNVVFCQPQQITWTGGAPPYYPAIIPGGQPSAPALKQFEETDQTSLRWVVDVQGAITFLIKDSTGETQYSDVINVQGNTCPEKHPEGGEEVVEAHVEYHSFAMESHTTITMPPPSGSGSPAPHGGSNAASGSSGASMHSSRSFSSAFSKPTGVTANKAPVLFTAALGFIGFATLLVAIAM